MNKTSFASAAPASEARNSMPPQEFEAFWSAVECCMLLQGGHTAAASIGLSAAAKASAANRGRTNRCGSCTGCLRGDCGACKNCRDKPKFGGKGIKKQACVRRACNNPLPDSAEGEVEDDDDAEPIAKSARVLATATDGFLSAESSPRLNAANAATSGFPPAFELEAHQPAAAIVRTKASDGSCGMLQDTRRRLQQLRAANGALVAASERPSSSMSMGYSTVDEYEADAAEPVDDAASSEQHSSTSDIDEAEPCPQAEPASGEALLVALACSRA